MNRMEAATALRDAGMMASLQLVDERRLLRAATALWEGGFRAVELPYFSIRGNRRLIPTLKEMDLLVGVGFVTRSSQVREPEVIGADFIATAVTAPDVVMACEEADVPCILGGLSPTEIWRAYEMRPDFVKVTDPGALGGPHYAGSLRGSLPMLHLVGGNMPLHGYLSYLEVGVEVLEFGGALLLPPPTSRDEWVDLSLRASDLVAAFESWRARRAQDIEVKAKTAQVDDHVQPRRVPGGYSHPS